MRPAGLLIDQVCEQFCTYVPPSRWEKIISHICMEETSKKKKKSGWVLSLSCTIRQNPWSVGMGIFSCPPYFSQNSTVRSEKSQGHQCGITQYMTRGVHNVLASGSAFQVIILYSNICSKAADSARFSLLYAGLYPCWNNLFGTQMDHIYIKKPVGKKKETRGFCFCFFSPWTLPASHSRQSFVYSSLASCLLFVVLRGPVPGVPVTWMGPGFARVLAGPGLRFAVGNIPIPMDFAVAIRYEAQVPFTPLPRWWFRADWNTFSS